MKLLFCTESLGKGGAERVIANLSSYFVPNNEVSILILDDNIDYKIDPKVRVVCVEKVIGKSKIKPIKLAKRYVFLKKFFRGNKYDAVVCFLPRACFWVMSAVRDNQKVIISVRNDPKVEYAKLKDRVLMKHYYPKAAGFVFQTEEAEEYFDNMISCKKDIIPNPINLDFVRVSFSGKRKKEIVSVGRLDVQKNHKMLVEAFIKISDEYPDYKLIIYGEGTRNSQRQALESIIKKTKMEDRVFLPGRVDDVREKIYKSSVFVLPSLYEGMPNALMEAMAMGLPVISTDCPCGGPRMLIENNKNGILVGVNDIDGLAKQLSNLLSDKSRMARLGKEASNIGIKYSPEIVNARWDKFIRKVVNE